MSLDGGPALLAARLAEAGALTDPLWRDVLARVPRHAFIPEVVWPRDERDRAWRVAVDHTDPAWRRWAYEDVAIVIQVDDGRPVGATSRGDPRARRAARARLLWRRNERWSMHYLGLDIATRVGGPLADAVDAIKGEGLHAQPLVLGRNGTPEAVVISVEQFTALREEFDDLLDAPRLRERLAQGDEAMEPTTMEALARELGIDLDR